MRFVDQNWTNGSRGRTAKVLVCVLGVGIITFFVGSVLVAYLGGLLVAGLSPFVFARYGPQIVEDLSGEGPMRSIVGADAAHYSNGWKAIVPGTIDSHQYPPEGLPLSEVRSWFMTRGAYDASSSYIHLALEGRSSEVVTVTGIEAVVENRRDLSAAAFVRCPSAGDNSMVRIAIDLEKPTPIAEHNDGSPLFSNYYLTLPLNEVKVFSIVATATTQAVEWRLAISFTHRGEQKRIVLNEDQEPLRTAPVAQAQTPYTWAWFDNPSHLIEGTV